MVFLWVPNCKVREGGILRRVEDELCETFKSVKAVARSDEGLGGGADGLGVLGGETGCE